MKLPQRADRHLARRGGLVELLRVPAAVFAGGVALRSFLYDRGWLPVERLATPVISVGNLSSGGTGKTPMVAWLAGQLRRRGLRAGVLSRGYGAAPGGLNDEGLELARRLADLPQVQDRDRAAGGRRLEGRGVDVILLDDGFQHRRLQRDLDLVLVDCTRPFGLAPPTAGGAPVRALLPRGLLREPLSALRRADAVVLTRVDAVSEEEREELARCLERASPGTPRVEATHVVHRIRTPDARDGAGLGALQGRAVDLVSAIGNPEAFERTVRALGGVVVEHRILPDHHSYEARDLAGLGARPLVTTAKDAVKLERFALPLWVVEVELEMRAGAELLSALLDALPAAPGQRQRAAIHEGLHG